MSGTGCEEEEVHRAAVCLRRKKEIYICFNKWKLQFSRGSSEYIGNQKYQ